MIKYNPKFLKIVDDLSDVCKKSEGNHPIRFNKNEEGVNIKLRNGSDTILLLINASSDDFDFPGDSICFYDYQDFYKYFSKFGSPEINLKEFKDTEVLEIVEGGSKINYAVSDPEVIGKENAKTILIPEEDTSFNFSIADVKKLKDMISLFKDDRMLVTAEFSGKTVTFKLVSEFIANTYEQTIELESEVDENFEFKFRQDVIKYLPNASFKVSVSNEAGTLIFNYNIDNIRVNIFLGSDEEDE